jgi:hypothetical protein
MRDDPHPGPGIFAVHHVILLPKAAEGLRGRRVKRARGIRVALISFIGVLIHGSWFNEPANMWRNADQAECVPPHIGGRLPEK